MFQKTYHKMFHEMPADSETQEAKDSPSHICDHPDCPEIGTYRAPKSRHALHEYFFFCLTHVRHYNKNWNYYEGMSAAQIEAERDADVIGHRPLWNHSLGESLQAELRDFLSSSDKMGGNMSGKMNEEAYQIYDAKTREALAILQVPLPVNLANIKSTYKNWVKKLHPDSHPDSHPDNDMRENNAQSQDKLKQINQAYAMLKLAFAEKSE